MIATMRHAAEREPNYDVFKRLRAFYNMAPCKYSNIQQVLMTKSLVNES